MTMRATKASAAEDAVYRDALKSARQLKREHRAYYDRDPKAFRALVKTAHNRVFRIKPGPKPKKDPRTAQAARKRAGGTPWRELYPVFIEGYQSMTEFTRSYAEEGFKAKVNEYRRKHPLRKFTTGNSPKQSPSHSDPVLGATN